jgi:hypothetical protein
VILTDRRLAALGFIVCLHAATYACSSRVPAGGVPVPPQTPTSELPTPERPASLPPATVLRPEDRSAECALIGEPGEPIATVALGDRIDPANAPHPSNESERLLFRQLYETLVRVDCSGRIAPALAASWRLDADGRTWIVTLRENARFSDGTPVTAADVRASWSGGGAGGLRPRTSRLIQSIVPLDDRTLAITLRSPRADVPLALAHTDLAVARSAADSRWPLGTRSGRIASENVAPDAIAASVITLERDDLSSIRFLVAPGDPRDLLDAGVDLLLTRDPAALEYAATLSQFQSVPLAWQRTHVLVSPGRTRTSPLLPEDARQVLADDAVRGEARGARGPFWWQMLPDCEVAHSPPGDRSSPAPRIVYDARDDAARDLAERFVGLVRASGPGAVPFLDALLPDRPRRTFQRATGLTGEALALARQHGTDAGYILSIDSRPIDPCRELHVLMDGVRWLDPDTIVPLVDTRLRAIVRRGRSGLTAEWDGGLLLAAIRGPK